MNKLKFTRGVVAMVLGLAMLTSGTTAFAASKNEKGFVITASNSASGNALLVFDKDLNLLATVPTGGVGSGAGLGNQGGIVVTGNTLLVVNAGNNTLSSFTINDGNLQLESVVSSHGIRPVSVAIRGNVVYVVNAGDTSIAGFTLDSESNLTFLPGSVMTLSGTAPAQIGFALEGKVLIVTEKGTNTIEVFPLTNNLPTSSVVTPSNGQTPFGFEVNGHNLIVSEAFGGNASAVSTYRINSDGTLTLISPSVGAPGQKAACWVATSKDGRFAFTTNTASDTVSSFRVRGNGQLELSQAVAATVPSSPIDMSVSGKNIFVLTKVGISPFNIGNDGTLGSLSASAIVSGANGLVTIER